MPDSQINQLFTYLSSKQTNQISSQRMKQIFTCIFKQSSFSVCHNEINSLKKDEFSQNYKKIINSEQIQDQLMFLFYHLDKEKKGYLSPADVLKMFEFFGKKVTPNQIQNSFKYAKVIKNKMSFEDFKQYFYNF